MKKYIIGVSLSILAVIVVAILWPSGSDRQSTSNTPKGTYIALGDSVPAGVGLRDYSDSSACDRTEQAYPNLVADKLGYTLESVACSGATTQNGLLGSQDVNQLAVRPQLDVVLGTKKPNLISITIGANDANWTTAIQKCYAGVCGSDADTIAAQAGITSAAANLGQALGQVKSRYPTRTPAVVVTGYYKLFPVDMPTSCTDLRGIGSSELAWIRQLQDSIDGALQGVAARYDFVTFVPVGFMNHELCTSDPWIQGLGSKAPYHPTDTGQAAIANQIVNALAAKRK
jgi:lysophospholipase L1-like esterase